MTAPSALEPLGVDTHFHVFTAHQAVPGARYVPAYDARFDSWRAAARGVGIGRGVVVQTSFMGNDNSGLVTLLQAHPDVLRGVAVVAPDATLSDLQPLHAHGVRGVRLNLAGTGPGAWRADAPLWPALRHLGWHVELHTNVGALPDVLPLVPADLPLVLDHMAKPAAVRASDATVRAVRERKTSAPVWLKLSGAYRLEGRDAQALAALWLDELGPQSLLWGSDWPCTNHEDEADYRSLRRLLDRWLPDATTRQAALVGNPRRAYGF